MISEEIMIKQLQHVNQAAKFKFKCKFELVTTDTHLAIPSKLNHLFQKAILSRRLFQKAILGDE